MIKILIPLLVTLEAADGILTYSAVGQDLIREGNPIIQNAAGTGSFLLLKIGGALLCGLLLYLVYKRFPRISLVTVWTVLIFYSVLFAWNLSILYLI
jgi:hypothetical protein